MTNKTFLSIFIFVPLVIAGILVFNNNAEAITEFAPPPTTSPSYCVAGIPNINTNGAFDVLSFIEYGKNFDSLTPTEQNKIWNLLSSSTPARDSSGLVPCGRQCDDPTTAVNEAAQCNFCHVFVLFHNVVNTLLAWALLLVILLVAAGGFLIMISGEKGLNLGGMSGLVGVPGTLTGKSLITSALIGYAIMLSAWIIVNLFFSLIGVASWVGIGNWWNPNCSVPGYTQDVDANGNPTGTWTYHQ